MLLLLACAASDSAPAPSPLCAAPTPSADALLPAGDNAGVFVLPDGRRMSPAGTVTEAVGFASDLVLVGDYAIVTSSSRSDRTLQVFRVSDGAWIGETARSDAYPGFALDGTRLYAAGGNSDLVDVFDVGDDGSLTSVASWNAGGFVAGLALDGAGHLWAALVLEEELVELDVATGAVLATVPVDGAPYAVAWDGATGEVWATIFAADRIVVVDAASATQTDVLDVGGNPSDLLLSPDGTTLWCTLSNDDEVVALDPATHAELDRVTLGDDVELDGAPLPGTSPSALAFDPTDNRLYVTRAADNAVDVLDADTLERLGSIPTGWYPTALALSGSTLVVTNGKGIGAGPTTADRTINDGMIGSVSFVPLDDANLAGWTSTVTLDSERPADVTPMDCDGTFPVPRHDGDPTPIEHVVLIVRENKTYDSLLGDVVGGDGDVTRQTFPAAVTPNLHALVDQFTSFDNFYDTSESSVQGHLALTGMFVNEYMERAWIEDYHGVGTFADDSATGEGTPGFGTVFTHLYRHGVPFTNYGEVVGAFDEVDGVSMGTYVDKDYPGVFFTLDVKDVDRAAYVTEQVQHGTLAPFTYMLLPRDHTYGSSSGQETAESMVADNDAGTGMVVDAISHSEFWASTVIFIVEDDPQSEADHVDGHRSILLVVSPYARRGHTSSVHSAYPSLYRTIFALLGVPPLSRHDALAAPLWDAFQATPDLTPFSAVTREWPEETNARHTGREAAAERCLDFSGPDRSPLLYDLQWMHRTGHAPVDSPYARGAMDCEALNGGVDEDDADAFDAAWARMEAWRREHPGVLDHVRRPARHPGSL